jgi:hypothetical protein
MAGKAVATVMHRASASTDTNPITRGTTMLSSTVPGRGALTDPKNYADQPKQRPQTIRDRPTNCEAERLGLVGAKHGPPPCGKVSGSPEKVGRLHSFFSESGYAQARGLFRY